MSFHEGEGMIDGVCLVRFSLPKTMLSRIIKSNWAIFKRALKERADVYHFHDLDFIPWAILLKLITRKKVIYDVHEAHPEYVLLKPYIPDYLKKPISKLCNILTNWSVFFDAIITNDNFVLRQFRHKCMDVIFNFPLLEFFSFTDNGIPYSERRYDVIFIGSLPKWHFTPMLEAARILKERGHLVKWLLLPTHDAPRSWMRFQLNEQNLSDSFTIADTVPFTSVPKYLYDSRIGIITIPPYKKYLKNIPLKMFEYMGCGLPVVASDLPPARQFVEGQDCAILVKHEGAAYAEAIISLLENAEMAEQMGQKGKKLVFDNYNWNIEEKKLIGIYERIFQDRGDE
jgi:glycosyltransferase involved in cell wall biosynthesis